jgi:plasmid maintenance system antidote protein VapI
VEQTDYVGRVQELMAERRWGTRELARIIKFDASYLSKVVRGQKPLTASLAAALDRAFDTGGELASLLNAAEDADAGKIMHLADDVVAAAARETSEHAELAEVSEVGPGALEQFRADVVNVAREYVVTGPLPLFMDMERIRRRISRALERTSHPCQANELYLLAGALSALMANASLDLGRSLEGDTFARAAWTYGKVTGHPGLMGWARGTQALIAMLDGRLDEAVSYAQDGLTAQRTGMGGARLYSVSARVLATAGREDDARFALTEAQKASERAAPTDLYDELHGEFGFDMAKQRYYEAVTRVQLGQAKEGQISARTAITLFEGRPARERSYGCEALARAQLALAQLMAGELDGADEALQPILRLPRDRRITSLVRYLSAGRQILNDSRFQGSSRARDLDEQLHAFCGAGLPRALTSG